MLRGNKQAKWCHQNLLDFKALTEAISIRSQLVRYMARFNIPVKSVAASDNAALIIQKCLLTGLFAHVARMQPDGSYRSINGTVVRT